MYEQKTKTQCPKILSLNRDREHQPSIYSFIIISRKGSKRRKGITTYHEQKGGNGATGTTQHMNEQENRQKRA